MKRALPLLALTALMSAAPEDRTRDRVLVYTHNGPGADGKGYVHKNIPAAVAAIRELAGSRNIEVEVSDDPSAFTNQNLRRFKAIVFANSNNEAFESESQRQAFRKFVTEGGGIVGIHSATGSERQWPYFQAVMGGKFRRHPKLQRFTVRVVDHSHPATRQLPAEFEWDDECYFHENLNPDIKPLLVTDATQLLDSSSEADQESRFGKDVPLSWYHQFGGGREYYISLGHKDEHYRNELFRQQLLGGILWAVGAERDPD